MATATVPAADSQDGLFDKEFDDPTLERKLDQREVERQKKADATASFKEVDDDVKAKLSELGLEPGDVARVGKYRISVTGIPSREVAFETSASKRVSISLLDS